MGFKGTKELFEALKYVAADKGFSVDILVEKLKNALILAVRKQYYGAERVNVVIDFENSDFRVSISKLVVEKVNDSVNEILFSDALKFSDDVKLFDFVEIEIDSKQVGRLAAQAAKQQILQGIRDIEKDNITEKMGTRVGTIIAAAVEMVDPKNGNVILKVDGGEAVLFKNNQLLKDEFIVGKVVRVYGVYIDSKKSNCLLKISRTHPEFVRKLFELEVPEIGEGKIEIKSIAREAGIRTKIAVMSHDPDLDPVGCLIGNRGSRVGAVVNELCGERIDIVKYSSNLKKFVVSALAPAEVEEIEILEIENGEKVAFVAVPESKISLAIGGRGLNTKLAAVLTGCKIDISPANMVSLDGSKKMLKEKIESRLKQQNVKKEESEVENLKFPEEIEEEADIHSFEVEQMLRYTVFRM